MKKPRRSVRAAFLCLALMAGLTEAAGAENTSADGWPHWGGPNGNFTTDATGLADRWPEEGPPRLWRRDLGEGYSAIVGQDGVLYTQYRLGERELVIALDAATGATIWERGYDSPTGGGWNFERGAGPHATPAVAGERIFTVGSTGKLHAWRRSDGSLLWAKDVIEELEGTFRHRGYSSSPIVHDRAVLIPVGGAGKTVVAFAQDDGSILWRGGDDDNSYSSPILIELDGRHQLVALGATEIVGLDITSGSLLWSHSHPTRNAFNISTPLWSDDGLLFVSSAYDGGGRVIRLTAGAGSTTVEELWFSNQMRVHFGTAIRLGDIIYASSGDFGPAPMAAVDVHTGEVLWRDRSFAKHSAIYADGKLILLDEDGVLGLVRVSREGLEVLSRAQVFDSLSWTVPTLVGSKLYIRNREQAMALELGM